MMTCDCERMVREFQARCGTEGTEVTPNKASLRAMLILEELHETVAAMKAGNAVETADGLADLLYVVVGTATACGERAPDDFIDPVCRLFEDGFPVLDFLADATYWLAAVTQALRDTTIGSTPDAKYRLGIAVRGMSGFVCRSAAACGVPLREVFTEVHRSNMTKEPVHAAPGEKYAPGGGKGTGFSPADVAGVLAKAVR